MSEAASQVEPVQREAGTVYPQPPKQEDEEAAGVGDDAVVVQVDADSARQAAALKEEANVFFKGAMYHQAIEKYSEAIDLDPTVAAYWANRAFAHIRTEQYGAAIQDAEKAMELEPTYVKAYYRRACANLALGNHKLSLADFRHVVAIEPNDRQARLKFKECQAIVRKVEFEKAVAMDPMPTKSVLETLDISSVAIPDSYDGPVLDEEPITLEFCTALIEHFKAQKKLALRCVYRLLAQIKDVLAALPSLVDVDVPEGTHFTVCGDTHGQFYDVCNIFELNGLPSKENPYLFNGDFVDRGSFSTEVVLTLFAFKLLYPQHVHLTRGNHETQNMNKIYGFEGEVVAKYSRRAMDLFNEVFVQLPLAACLGGKVLVVHGGLFSKDGVTLDMIRKVERRCEPPQSGIMCDLMWSDPAPEPGRAPSKRGVSVHFGPDVTERFLADNNLDLLIRSHEVKQDGYSVDHNGKCITVFSAPNYCDQVGNMGALIKLNDKLQPEFVTFSAVPHPNVRPMAYAGMSPFSGMFY